MNLKSTEVSVLETNIEPIWFPDYGSILNINS